MQVSSYDVMMINDVKKKFRYSKCKVCDKTGLHISGINNIKGDKYSSVDTVCTRCLTRDHFDIQEG